MGIERVLHITSRAADLAAVLALVKEATGPSEELDAMMICVILAPPGAYVSTTFAGAWCVREEKSRRVLFRSERWPVTVSTDKALEMVELMFPRAQLALYTGWPLSRYVEPDADGARTFGPDSIYGCWARSYGGEYLGPLYNASCEGANGALAVVGVVLQAELCRATGAISPAAALKALSRQTPQDQQVLGASSREGQ
jgi:hypothetical protein